MLAPVHRGAPRRLYLINPRLCALEYPNTFSSILRRFAHSSTAIEANVGNQDALDWDHGTRIRTYQYGRVQSKQSGKSFRRKTASLPVTSSGKGAKVLIIESAEDESPDDQLLIDENLLQASKLNEEVYPETASNEDTPIVLGEAAVDGGGLENALMSIEKMRPEASQKHITVLTYEAMNELARQLHRQFSAAQLREYAQRNLSPEKEDKTAKSLLEQPLPVAWHWDRRHVVTGTGVQIKTARQTRKALAISTIFDKIWGIKSESDTDRSCRVSRVVSSQAHELISSGVPSALDELSTMFNISHSCADRKAREDCKVNLTGSERSLALATNHLQLLLDKSKGTAQQVSVAKLQKPSPLWHNRSAKDNIPITESDLKQISNHTGAVLNFKDGNNSILQVHGIDEERILAAKQALSRLVMYRWPQNIVSMCAANSDQPVDLVKSPASLLQRLPSPYDKFSQRRVTGVRSTGQIFDANEHVEWITKEVMPTLEAKLHTYHDNSPDWKTRSANDCQISASFGFHLKCGSLEDNITSSMQEKGRVSSYLSNPTQSHFWKTVPNAHLFFRRLNSKEEKIKRTIKVKVELVPDMTAKTDRYNNAPDISLTFSLNKHETGDARLQQVAIELDSQSHTVMLPNSAMDLQFYNRSRTQLDFRHHSGGGNAALAEFCLAATAKLGAGQPIRHLAGPLIKLPASFTRPNQPMISVPYMIADVDQRETVSFKLVDERPSAKKNILPFYVGSYAHTTSGDPAYANSVLSLRIPSWKHLDGIMDRATFERSLPLIKKEFVKTTLWLLSKLDLVQKSADYKSQPKRDDLGIN